MERPPLRFPQMFNMSFGFLGIRFGWGLQLANMSAVYERLGARPDEVPLLWLAAPVTGLVMQSFFIGLGASIAHALPMLLSGWAWKEAAPAAFRSPCAIPSRSARWSFCWRCCGRWSRPGSSRPRTWTPGSAPGASGGAAGAAVLEADEKEPLTVQASVQPVPSTGLVDDARTP